MDSTRPARLVLALAGGAALIGMGMLTACSSSETEAPETTTTTSEVTTTTAEPSVAPLVPTGEPTEKRMDPTAGNRFTPGKTAPPAQTVAPGQHHPPRVG